MPAMLELAARDADANSDGEVLLIAAPTQPRSTKRLVVAAAFSAALLLGTAGVVALPRATSPGTGVEHAIVQYGKPIEIVPSRGACSKPAENCLATGCCVTSGATCFVTKPGYGMCNLTCTPGLHGYSCEAVPKKTLPASYTPGTSMYCIVVYTNNTGSTKKSYELDLLKMQLKSGYGVFACDAWDAFADVSTELSPGIFTIAVTDVYGEFHFAKRKNTGTWVNWGLFFQVWLKVRALGKWNKQDYTVKTDADAVFLPERLAGWLSKRPVAERGVYYETCPGVDSGFFGNLEVISHDAIASYLALLENCHDTFGECAKVGCDWPYGPWGEDVFAQRCMDRGLVAKVEAFDLTTDGACPHDRPKDQRKNKKWHADCSVTCTPAMHPYKKPAEWLKCMQATKAASCPSAVLI